MWPMSDVPAAAFWTAALLTATRSSVLGSIASGVLAGSAIVIRPNLAPLGIIPALLASWPYVRHEWLNAFRNVLAFGLACLPFVLFVAWLNHDLYGSPFQSGYGASSSIFAASNLGPNMARFPRWLWQTQGPLIFVFPFALLTRDPSRPWSGVLRRVLLLYVAIVFGCYLWYTPFDGWWYLRFVLPAFPALFVLAADAAWRGMNRLGTRVAIVSAAVFTFVIVDYGITQARARDTFGIGVGEQKYADVGRYVATHLPPNAVVLTMQHSGSIRYYSSTRTLQWESLEAGWLDRAVAHLRASGLEPFIVLEGWEIEKFRARFASQQTIAFLERPALAAHRRDVFIYDTSAMPSGDATPRPIPATTGCE